VTPGFSISAGAGAAGDGAGVVDDPGSGDGGVSRDDWGGSASGTRGNIGCNGGPGGEDPTIGCDDVSRDDWIGSGSVMGLNGCHGGTAVCEVADGDGGVLYDDMILSVSTEGGNML
jgi:hypothetical protein